MKVSEPFLANIVEASEKIRNPQIPWKKIIGMRNRLTHAYWDIDLDVVWKTAIERIPELHEQLSSMLPK